MTKRVLGMTLGSPALLLLTVGVTVCGVRARYPGHHVNVCNFLPSDEELAEIAQRQGSEEGADEYGHRLITIKTYLPREHILISILEDEPEDPEEYMYLAQAVQSSGKAVGNFKSFDEYLPMRKCGDKEVFYNDENMDIPDGEVVAGGVTFEWVAPNSKSYGPVTVIVTKVNMNLLHRHHHEDHIEGTTARGD